VIWAMLAGYAIGSLPTADAVARGHGVDLRTTGTGNPGTANALRVGGGRLAATVLLLDLAKGAAAALIGRILAGDAGGVAGAVLAAYGQVANPWHGFRGGKGLAVTGGALLVLWPYGAAAALPALVLGASLFGSAAGGLVGLLALGGAAVLWAANGWPTAWGIAADDTLVWLAIGIVVITAPKFTTGTIDRLRSRMASAGR
jgi:acyl phosphate:glycerol-3-phosphate acyltransferase